ncbi:glutathione S-transferase family protein [Elstera cyanobacteriorum]|uniref:glutathione S-transferase family protein n=1 Tax=Elstera cyanobacteriorum TaxID=2022747 RepID=UPI0023546011|nr:glutathione S-transferase family protein [Elstera cyanobacteriorum]MCK6441923.1 glutathione S-transferase family protein [Elstera cyanobacteriorum]
MSLSLFAHPLSSYCQKVLVALYELGTPFTFRQLGPDQTDAAAEFARLWPLQRMPALVDGDRTICESTVIIEYLDRHYPGAVRLVPEAEDEMLEARFLDRVFDNYIQTPQQKVVFDALRGDQPRDPVGVAQARALLEQSYAWLDDRLAGRQWAIGDRFSLADCAAAPALFYADWTHPIDPAFTRLYAYRERLKARPSFKRAIDEARPYRGLFPLGAPDRD